MTLKTSLTGLALALLTVLASAQPVVKVEKPWVRGTVPGQPATGAFMQLSTTSPLRLVEARSPVAGVVEIHEMAMVGDVMKMRPIAGLDLPVGRTTELKPGGYHVMLMSLKQTLKGGDSVPITLVFQDGSGQRHSQDIVAPVTALGTGNKAPAAPATHEHKH